MAGQSTVYPEYPRLLLAYYLLMQSIWPTPVDGEILASAWKRLWLIARFRECLNTRSVPRDSLKPFLAWIKEFKESGVDSNNSSELEAGQPLAASLGGHYACIQTDFLKLHWYYEIRWIIMRHRAKEEAVSEIRKDRAWWGHSA